jgi:hypothetical protein
LVHDDHLAACREHRDLGGRRLKLRFASFKLRQLSLHSALPLHYIRQLHLNCLSRAMTSLLGHENAVLGLCGVQLQLQLRQAAAADHLSTSTCSPNCGGWLLAL